ncbi:putative ribonuclease H-like domain-containing protein [Tanacetum coccineum]
MLKPDEYEIWRMRIEQYIQMIDYALWEVIENGATFPKTTTVEGVVTEMPIRTAEEKAQRRLEVKARNTLMMGIPNEHQLKFNSIKDAKKLLEAVEKRFGGNEATKKTQRNLLKQQYENFTAPSSEMLDQTFDRLQKLVSQLELLDEKLSQEDVNQKLLRSLSPEWNTHAVVWRNKADLDTMSMDDLYNNLKVYEPEVKGMSSSSSISTASTQVNAANSTNIDNLSDAVICAFFASQPNSPQLVHEDLQQIHPDDMEEMDLRWQMAMLTMRARKFLKNLGRKLIVNGNETIELQESRQKNKERLVRSVPVETLLQALWYPMDSICSKSCLKTIESLKSQNDQLLIDLKKSELMVLDEFVNEHVVENNKAMSSKEEPKVVRKNGDAPIIEEWVSDDEEEDVSQPKIESKTVKPSIVKKEEIQNRLQDQGVIDSGCSRHMTGNMSYLTDYEEIDGGYVTFGGNPKGGKITGKGTIKTGHLNFKTMNKLVKGNLVRGLPSKIFENNQTCVACQKEKQHRASCKFKIENSISLPLHLLHMDSFGPTFVKSLMKKMYCLVVTDDYSRFTWVFFLATKDETSGILKSFITGIENLVDHKAKVIRCDNGTEFKNKEMNQFCKMKGILRQFSIARTPQQNGVAERRNMTLIEAARTMLADSKLPTTFWAEAVNTACYVQNRVLVVKPHNKTPYELFHGRTPTLSFMRPFGCPVTILNTIDHLGKFDGKADEGFFVGYSLNSKAFRVFNSRTRIVEEKLHIRFSEVHILIVLQIIEFADDGSNFNSIVNDAGTNEVNVVDDEDDGVVANMNNLDTTIQVSPIPSTRIHKHHPLDQVIGDLQSATQTRKMSKNLKEHWKNLKRNKNDEMGIVIRNKARLVAQGYTQEEGIDYDKVFAPVARIEAIRLFLAYASFKDLMVYQMDVKSVFLYGKIEKEVYLLELGMKTLLQHILLGQWVFKRGKLTRPYSSKGTKVIFSDIMFAVCACARYQVNPKVSHLHAVKRIFRYLKGQLKLGLWYLKDSPFDLVAYTNSDYARASLDRKSTTGGCQFLGCRLISWQCKKQTVVANFITEAEYVAASSCCGQVLWIQNQLRKAKKSVKLIMEKIFRMELELMLVTQNEEGIECLPNSTIFEQLALMDLKTTAWNEFSSTMASAIICLATNQKFNFSKYIFKSMIRNLDNLSGKFLMYPRFVQVFLEQQLDDLSTHNRIYVAPSHTKKIFRNMRRVGKGFSGRVTPLFQTMVVQNQSELGEGSANPTDPHHTPTIIQSSTQPQKTQKPRKPKRKDTQIPQSSDPSDNVADEAVHKELGDSLVRAATTASSLKAKQDSGNITKTRSKATPNESSSLGTTLGGGPRYQETIGDTIAQTRFENLSKHSNDSLLARGNTLQSDEDRLKLKELMELCTNLQNRVLDLEKTKTTQANEIASLKKRVKKLEKKNRSRTHKLKRLYKVGLTTRVESSGDEESLGEDASKQGRINAINADDDITLVSVQDDTDKEMFDVDALNGEEVFVAGQNENVVKEIVDAAQVSTAATTVTITTEEITLAQALEALKTLKPKVKGIVFQEPGKSTTTTTISSQQSQDKGQNENVVEEIVDIAQVSTAATTVTITTEEITLAQALEALKTSKPKDKGKGIMIEEPVKPMKKKDLIMLDEEVALKLQVEFDEEERLAKEKAKKEQEANIALIETWDDIQAKIDVDHQLAERLQAQEQEELSIEENATLFQQLLKKRRKHFAAKRAEEKRTKPPTKAQQRKIMCTYLKNVEGYKLNDLKLKDFDSIQEMFDRAFKRVNTFEDFRTELVKGKEKREGTELAQEITKKQKVEDDKEIAELKQCLIYMLVEKKYPLTPATLTMMLEKKLMIDYESEMAYQLLKFITKQLKK